MPPPLRRTKRNTGPWSTPRILNATSPIITKDIHAFLVTCISGWDDSYNENEKRAIIDRLPTSYRKYDCDHNGRLICPISLDFILKDPYVKNAIPKFKNDISEGFYEKGWQTQARKAVQERQDGNFDEYLRDYTEELFSSKKNREVVATSIDSNQTGADSSDGEWGTRKAKGRSKDQLERKVQPGKRDVGV